MLFDDEPARKGSSWSHLEGLHPHSSVSERLDAIAFTVFRAYHCTDMSRHQQRLYSSGPRVTELIHIQSPVLRSALQAVATYIPGDDFSQTWNLTTPHVFISHHRDALLNRARQEGESCMEDLKHLFEYVYTKWADPILTLERLTKAGNIDAKRLPWLYKPNEMIISIVKGVPTAYVLKSDPSWNEELTGITLECWAWDYNGFLLQRKGHELFVATPSNSDPTPIRNLSAYPLRFATKEVKDSVLARGRKYWGLRYQHHVSYLGWDAKGDRNQMHARLSNLQKIPPKF
ncbi:hypothetical protein B0I35DRAFT_116862 [Stachybotrys elegans]|uniref:DUF7025 domain-containing protein n=1 Tax=Stachybotrys elegans TaxID=80388 RepID=A0A8K0SV01_9HYPO|nr:hypothetical protein B0I35DRAFT_116862 [Stachybotrys elegans]